MLCAVRKKKKTKKNKKNINNRLIRHTSPFSLLITESKPSLTEESPSGLGIDTAYHTTETTQHLIH